MNSIRSKILFRADGDSIIGHGHIVRCLALSDILRKDFEIIFAIVSPSKELKKLVSKHGKLVILNEGSKDIEYQELSAYLEGVSVCVLDGYQFDENYQRFIKAHVSKLVMIDDLADRHYLADIVINHAGSLSKNDYSIEHNTRLLLGPDYALLRTEFIRAAKAKREITKIDTVFICMGGADPNFLTKKILLACLNTGFIKQIIIVIGSSFPYTEELNKFVDSQVKIKKHITIKQNVDAETMIYLMRAAEICIVPSSSVSLEVACVKSGLLTGVAFANQQFINNFLSNYKLGVSVGDFNTVTENEISKNLEKLANKKVISMMIENQFTAFDGNSEERLLQEFRRLSEC